MKKNLIIIVLALISFGFVNAQDSSTKRADKLFDRFEFVKAAEKYLELIEDDNETDYVIKRLADSYYNIYDSKEAEKWYAKIIKNKDPEVIYRYSQMLKANGKYKESNKWMSSFSEMRPYDSRAIAFKNTPNYIDKIIGRGKKFNIQNIDINSEYSDFGSIIKDKKIYFTSSRNTDRKSYGWNDEPFLDIYSSTINEKGSFLEPNLLEDLNSKFHEGILSFSADGNTIYFTRESFYEKEFEKSEENKNKYGQSYIYKATKLKDKFNIIESLDINDPSFSNKNPMVSPDGKHLYFSSNRPGGFGMYDIYKANINDDGTLSDVENLGQNVNSEGQEGFPFFSNDNVLYFSSDGHLGIGGLDVFYSRYIDGKWSNVRNVGIPVNSGADDFAFIIDEYNENGFVSSNRPGGVGKDDIYALKKIKPICDILLESTIVDSKTNNPIETALTSISDGTGVIENTKESDPDGLVAYILECGDEFNLVASKEGYETKSVAVKLTENDPPMLTIMLDPIEELIVERKIELNNIYFDFDKFNITSKAAFELDKLVAVMKKYPDINIIVESHTDSRGSSSYNQGLSERRANATVQYVISKGIAEGRLEAVGKGEEESLFDCSKGCSKDQHSQNRRSEFIIE